MYINKRSLKMSSHQKQRLLIDWLNNSALKDTRKESKQKGLFKI